MEIVIERGRGRERINIKKDLTVLLWRVCDENEGWDQHYHQHP